MPDLQWITEVDKWRNKGGTEKLIVKISYLQLKLLINLLTVI